MIKRGACGAGLVAAAIAPAAEAQANQDPYRACMQAYTQWIALRDARLRRLEAPQVPALLDMGGAWCTPRTSYVDELKTKLVGLDGPCKQLPEDKKQQVVELMIQGFSMLKRVTTCPQSNSAVVAAPRETLDWQANTKPAARTETKLAPAATPKAERRPADRGTPARPKPAQARSSTEPPSAAPPATTRLTPESDVRTAPSPRPEPPPPALLTDIQESLVSPTATARHFQPSDEGCLTIEGRANQRYVVDASRCTSRVTLAAIDLYPSGAPPRCITARVANRLEIEGESTRPPEINFQCIALAGGCTPETLRKMFPECQAQ